MARPFIRRVLKRAGVALPKRPAEGSEAERRIPLPKIFFPGESEDAGPIDFTALFGREVPVELEIGTGKGRFLIESAAARPETNWLGLEIEPGFVELARLRIARRGLMNVRVEPLDGREFVIRRLSPGSLAALHVYFADPWPKKRHMKRRLFTPGFAAAAARALARGGMIRAATDHEEYWTTIEKVLGPEPLLVRLSDEEAGPWSSGTNYELKALASGRPVFKAVFRRRDG
jgi:tRNA (guanine-N7-)-methyltransferase